MSPEQYEVGAARATAGRAAMAIVERNGPDLGAEIMREYLRVFFLGHAAVAGWDATLNLVQELSYYHLVSQKREKKLQLVVSNPGVSA